MASFTVIWISVMILYFTTQISISEKYRMFYCALCMRVCAIVEKKSGSRLVFGQNSKSGKILRRLDLCACLLALVYVCLCVCMCVCVCVCVGGGSWSMFGGIGTPQLVRNATSLRGTCPEHCSTLYSTPFYKLHWKQTKVTIHQFQSICCSKRNQCATTSAKFH